MAREFEFVQVDVFTEQILAGNGLAVFLDARGLDDREMQTIAREMNQAETVFVFPSSRTDCVAAIRIFTPAHEVPFAGHPTVGTSWVLATEGVTKGATRFVLEERIGPVPVEVEGDPTRPRFIWMQHRDATFGPEVKNRAGIAAALGLTEADLIAGVPIEPGSTGNEFLYVPLRDRADGRPGAARRARPRGRARQAHQPRHVRAGARPRSGGPPRVLADVRAGGRRAGGSRHRLGQRRARRLSRAAPAREVARRG